MKAISGPICRPFFGLMRALSRVSGDFSPLRGLAAFALLGAAGLAAIPAYADTPVLSGSLETGSTFAILAEDYASLAGLDPGEGRMAWNFYQGANLRFKAAAGEFGTVNGAFNLRAWSADAPDAYLELASLAGADTRSLRAELATSAEIERLYLTLRGENADLDAGLMRLAFGYAPAFRPTDIVNPPNPLYPDARPRGVLGLSLSAYPAGDAKIQAFAATRGQASLDSSGTGSDGPAGAVGDPVRPLVGLSADLNARRFSLEPVYFARFPVSLGEKPDQYAGFSLKVEAGAGLTLEVLWSNEDRDAALADSLTAAAGADWSAFDAKLYLLGQYLWNGPGSRGVNGVASLSDRHYGFARIGWQWDDYTNFGISALGNLEDGSMMPALTLSHEPLQGLIVSLTGRLAVDAAGNDGEFSPLGSGSGGTKGSLEAKGTVRF